MTPEQARELLVDLDLDSVPPYEKSLSSSELFEVRDKERNLVAGSLTEREAGLLVAAPALAEQIANMRYEYSVVCLVEGDVWRYAQGGVLITPLAHEATWLPTREEAEAYAERRRSTAKETRVVPRLVSEPEVVA